MRGSWFAGSVIGLLLASIWTCAAAISLQKSFPFTILGVKVTAPVTGSFDVRSEGDELVLRVQAQASLKDIQDKALQIARAAPMPTGNCDRMGLNPVVNSIDTATIVPDGISAKATLSGHVTAWLCERVLGQIIKTAVDSDSVTLTAPVIIIVIDHKQLGLKLSAPVSIEAGHNLTIQVLNLLGQDINAKLTAALTHALDASEARAQLPALPGLTAQIESASFAANGDELLVRATGEARMNSATFEKLLNSMKE